MFCLYLYFVPFIRYCITAKKISLSSYLWLSLTWSFFLSFSVKKAKLQGPPGNGLFASCMKQLWLYNCLRLKEEKITHHSVNCHSDECLVLKWRAWIRLMLRPSLAWTGETQWTGLLVSQQASTRLSGDFHSTITHYTLYSWEIQTHRHT